jgi:hypothetical protein
MNAFESQLYGALSAMEKRARKSVKFDFDKAVFDCYMKNGKPATAAEIAELAGVSVSTVRKVISNDKYRSSIAIGYRRVEAYQPSLSMMREKIIELQ